VLAGRSAGGIKQGGNMLSPGAADQPAIVAEGASKLFLDGTVVAFHQLALAVKRNEIMCVVGPSGCGKTTLLRSIAGLTDLSSGKLLVHGKPVAGRPPDGVAMVFQHFGLLPWKTVYDNAAFGLAMAGAPRADIKERVAHYLELTGLTGFEGHYPYQLSGGMQQRVGLVRALAMNPSILLMDEPFAALDAQTREILQEELLQLMERPDERKTMVFITHSIDEAILLGDRIAVMSARPGRIKEVLDMPFGWPRNADAVRSDPRFTEFRLHIWHQLHAARPAPILTLPRKRGREGRGPREVA
jgi:NitT/TauT family transport system ATP-binding protein